MANNVNDLYTDVMYKLRGGVVENSRNGQVITIQSPVACSVANPTQRVLFNDERQANPYFHVMETVWMLAGYNEVGWLKQFNYNIESYAEDSGVINGAYGHRWFHHFDRDQVLFVINELGKDVGSRQAVIAMYDPAVDQNPYLKDRPCNTHLYFRVVNGKLNMTVCNRSNDAVWGMVGANIVHMTYLMEAVAHELLLEVGTYFIMTNNLHIYEPHWHLMRTPIVHVDYAGEIEPYPLLQPKETLHDLRAECRQMASGSLDRGFKLDWMENVAAPMLRHYKMRAKGKAKQINFEETAATDWRLAEQLWHDWRINDNK